MDNEKNISGWRAEELAKVFLLKSDYELIVDRYPTPLFDFLVTMPAKRKVKFAVEVKTTIGFQNKIKRQLIRLKAFREIGAINTPVLLFKIDEKSEKGEVDFLVIPSFKENRLLFRHHFKFEELNQSTLKLNIETIIKWYRRK